MRAIDWLVTFALMPAASSCGASAGSGEQFGPAGSGGQFAAGGAGSAASSGGMIGSGGALTLDAGNGDAASLTPDAACAAESFAGEPAPLNLMVMLDRSCSMGEPASAPLWDKTKAGLTSFFQSPALDGVGVALHFFPSPETDYVSYCQGDQATPTVALDKLSAALAPTDVQEQKLIAAMNAQTLHFAGTPMFQALYGAIAFAKTFAAKTLDEQIVVVLVTDGVPGESCDFLVNNNIPKIAALAKLAFDEPPSVPTFTIGLQGSQEADMIAIAQAGGGAAFFLGGSQNVEKDLFAKLDSIKQSNLGCSFKLPEPKPGKSADASKVNVELESGGTIPLFKVDGKSACVPNGWYYDDPGSPTKILLCPGACESVKKDPSAKVEVLVGCASIAPR